MKFTKGETVFFINRRRTAGDFWKPYVDNGIIISTATKYTILVRHGFQKISMVDRNICFDKKEDAERWIEEND